MMPEQMRDYRTVTVAATLKRVNRILAKDEEQLRKNRGGPYSETLPEWICVDLNRNTINGGTGDLEAFAREVGALKVWERMAEEH